MRSYERTVKPWRNIHWLSSACCWCDGVQLLLSPDPAASSSWQHLSLHQPPAGPAVCTSRRSPDPERHIKAPPLIAQARLEPGTSSLSCFRRGLSHHESFEPGACRGAVAMATQLTTKKKPMLIILAVRRTLWWASPLRSISCWERTSPTPTNEPADRRDAGSTPSQSIWKNFYFFILTFEETDLLLTFTWNFKQHLCLQNVGRMVYESHQEWSRQKKNKIFLKLTLMFNCQNYIQTVESLFSHY